MCERQGERHVSRQKGGRRRKGKSPLIFQLWWPAIPNIPAPSSFSFFAVLLCRFFFTASVRGEKARGPLPCSIQLEIMHIPMSLVPWESCFTFISLIPLPRQKGDRNIYDTLQCNLKKLLSSFHIYFWGRQNNDGSLCLSEFIHFPGIVVLYSLGCWTHVSRLWSQGSNDCCLWLWGL